MSGQAPGPFDPPRAARVVPPGVRIARGLAIVVVAISGSMVIGGTLVGLFVGPHVIVGSVLWAIPGFASLCFLRSRLADDGTG